MIPYTFNEKSLNSDKKYCPVCGELLEIHLWGKEEPEGWNSQDIYEEKSSKIEDYFKKTSSSEVDKKSMLNYSKRINTTEKLE